VTTVIQIGLFVVHLIENRIYPEIALRVDQARANLFDSASVFARYAWSYYFIEHHAFDFSYRIGWIESFGADINTIHNGMTAKQAIGIFKVIKSFSGGLISIVGEKAISL